MILYNSDYFGLPQLAIVNGSAVYRTFLPSLGSMLLMIWVHAPTLQKPETDATNSTIHPFVITIYIMAFSLITTHRLNYCYQRYWESCSNLFAMTSKWTDSATTLASPRLPYWVATSLPTDEVH